MNKIAMNAHDFSMLLDDVSTEALIANSGVEAFDVSNQRKSHRLQILQYLQTFHSHWVTIQLLSKQQVTSENVDTECSSNALQRYCCSWNRFNLRKQL
ncbi:hypothetical protein [Erysipelothrix piscisicarius]|uniref:hypothetical protein n=1 Tax=Erysipelothrix piscisicarius TaxID=2485784 RepID=UPI001E641B2B|nr:hypothetical protein [Erysipelothrix piscisicarius]